MAGIDESAKGVLKLNTGLAQEAVHYVQSKMTVGASNKIPDVLGSLGMSLLCVRAERSVTDDFPSNRMLPYLRLVAAAAENVGCGNCGEQSADAFIYLFDKGVRPLDWAALQDPGDHAFVVIDRDASSNETNPATWGSTAVVCDPWRGEVYRPDFITRTWRYKPYSIFRAD
jgi:hypothetical protein